MRFSGLFAVYAHQRCHHAGHIRAFRLDRHRIGRKRVLLHVVDIRLNAIGEGQDQRNSDDADGAREGGQDRASLLCHQVIEAQTQRRKKRHGRAPLTGFRLHRRLRRVFIRRAVRQNASVEQPHRPRSVARGKLRVVRDHDNELFVRDLLQKLHDLHRRFTVQRAGRLVGQQNLRIVDQRPRNRHALHLSAGHLVGLFMQLVTQTDLFQRLHGALSPLGLAHARKRQR